MTSNVAFLWISLFQDHCINFAILTFFIRASLMSLLSTKHASGANTKCSMLVSMLTLFVILVRNSYQQELGHLVNIWGKWFGNQLPYSWLGTGISVWRKWWIKTGYRCTLFGFPLVMVAIISKFIVWTHVICPFIVYAIPSVSCV